MIENIIINIGPYIDILVFIYTTALIITYIMMGILALYSLIRYIARNKSTNYDQLLYGNQLAPSISIIASCYNESKVIVDCIHSLCNIRYNNYDIIIVNDGSTDDTLEKMCSEFSLVKTDFIIPQHIKTAEVKGVYHSTDKAYFNLIVVDKENGGKADAMNCGYNISSSEYGLSIDADSVLSSDALLKLAKPITESRGKQIIAVGAAIHVANGCEFRRGVMVKEGLPDQFHVRIQIIEYLRAFLIGRMAFAQINALSLISGALGMFRKDVILAIGGYRTNCIGEDLEITMRLRKYLYENKIKHKVIYIPNPLLWTEVPSSYKILDRQRTRWTRGLIFSLKLNKDLFFNCKYGVLGLVSYPYFIFFEWLAPFIEALGLIYFVILILLNMVIWKVYLVLFLYVFLFGTCFSLLGILCNEITYHIYNSRKDLIKLFLTSVFEIFVYHPLIVYYSIKGNIMYMLGMNSWGIMSREGFNKKSYSEKTDKE